MLLPSENRIVRFLEYVIGCIIAAIIGLAVAAIGMSLGCAKPAEVPSQTFDPSPSPDESHCMAEAAKRITESVSCQEAWLKIVSLGVQDKRCSPFFKPDGNLMTVLVCDSSLSENGDSTR